MRNIIGRGLSLRLSLTLWYLLVLAGILVAFSIGTYEFVRMGLNTQLDEQLEETSTQITAWLRTGPSGEDTPNLDDLEAFQPFLMFELRQEGRQVFATAAWKKEGLDAALQAETGSGPRTWIEISGGDWYRIVQYEIDLNESVSYDIAFAVDATLLRSTLSHLALTLGMGVPIALGLGLVGGLFLAGRALAPVGTMAAKAREISADRLGERLPIRNPQDELGRLASVFNAMLERLEESFDSLRRFTADASHELRTPLTVLRSVGEVGLREPRDGEAYRNIIGSMLEETDRLNHLVESLLTLSRADSGKVFLRTQPADLGDLARDSVAQLGVLAEEKAQSIEVRSEGPVLAHVDWAILRQAVDNLLDNAIKYGPPGSAIRISVLRTVNGSCLEVADQGPGIPSEHLHRIFDRFHRVDTDRSRESGGVGLGLSVARWAVEAHGGTIEAEGSEAGGSTFRIRLPAACPA